MAVLVSPGPNASDLLSLMEMGLSDLLKAEITCFVNPVHLVQNRGGSLASNSPHCLQGFFPCA